MKSNVLFTVTDLNLIEKVKGYGINKFVYPLSFFCVGIPNTFEICDMTEKESYILINKTLNTKDINVLQNLLSNLPSNIKGFIFEDLGVLELIKNLNVEKIYYNPHFNCNFQTINYMFEYVDEIILPLDLNEIEIDQIIKNANKKVSIVAFSLIPAMYSRRFLNTNYAKHHHIENKNPKELKINNNKFISVENEFGTVIYHYPFFNGERLLKKDINYAFYNPILLDNDKILDLLNNDFNNINYDYGFLDSSLIYKIRKDEK